MADAFLTALIDPVATLHRAMPQSRLVRAPLRRAAWRRLPEHHVCFVLRSEGAITLPDGVHRLAPGTLLWLPPDQPHRLAPCAERTLFRLRFRLERGGVAVALPGGPWLLPDAWPLLPLIELAHRDWQAVSPAADLRLRCLLAVVLSQLLSGDVAPSSRPVGGLSVAQRDAVEQRLAGWATMGFPDPAALARAAGLGHDWFGRAFTRSYGVPARRWLADRRLDLAARQLIAAAEPVERIARRLGFAQLPQFNRRFRIRFGASPARWRAVRVP